jgi:hypothetical protein
MFQALTPALQAAGATIVRVSPHVARFAGVAAVVTTVSYVDYRINRDVIDPFVERQSAKLARRADRRAARIAALRRERFMTMTIAEFDRKVAAEVERRMTDIPAATRRRTVRPDTVAGEVFEPATTAAATPSVETESAPA